MLRTFRRANLPTLFNRRTLSSMAPLMVRGKEIKNVLLTGCGPITASYILPVFKQHTSLSDITLWTEHRIDLLRSEGIRVKKDNSIEIFNVNAVTDPSDCRQQPDLVIWGNQRNVNEERIGQFKAAFGELETSHLILQNGIGNEEPFEQLGRQIARGIVYVTAAERQDSDGPYFEVTADNGLLIGPSKHSDSQVSEDIVTMLEELNYRKITYIPDIFIKALMKTGYNLNNYVVLTGGCNKYGEIDFPGNEHLAKLRDHASREFYGIFAVEFRNTGISYDDFKTHVNSCSVTLAGHMPTHRVKQTRGETMEDLLGHVIAVGQQKGFRLETLKHINQVFLEYQQQFEQHSRPQPR